MTQDSPYRFRPVRFDDLPMLARWRQNPHVSEWWDADGPVDLGDERVSRYIVAFEGEPFAFMQDYTVHGWVGHHFGHLPEGARGIDQFIGEPDMIGHGHGTAFIGLRMHALFGAGAPVIATDPHPENARAIATYKKLGFSIAGAPTQTKWGVILPMTARRPTRPSAAAASST